MKYKVGKDLYVELVKEPPLYPEHIVISDTSLIDGGIVIWTKDETFKLAYKLMSLASEME